MKRFKISLLILSAIMAFNTATSQVNSKTFGFVLKKVLNHSVPEVSIKEAATLHNKIFLDAREPEEYAVSHLPNSVFVGYDHFDKARLKSIAKNQPIVVYCSIGKRSELIAEQLIKEGFTNVSNLYGGIFEWVNQGKTVVDLQEKPTENVHAYSRIWGKFLARGHKVY